MLTVRVRERLIALRDEHGLTDAGWARAAGEVQQEVSRFTTGDMKMPKLDFMDRLARVFHRTLADVLADDLPLATLTVNEVKILAGLKAMKPVERAGFETLVRNRVAGGSARRRGSPRDRRP